MIAVLCYTEFIMKKTTVKKKTRLKRITPKILGVVILVTLLILMVLVQFWFNNHLLNRVQVLEGQKIERLITESIKAINKDPVIEPISGKVYLIEPRLVLPAYPQQLIRGIHYGYSPALVDVKDEEELQITSDIALNYGITGLRTAQGLNGVFDAVPTAQACTRQMIIKFKPGSESSFTGYSPVSTRKLADGRTLELFTADQCNYEADELVKYIEQIQSY